MAQTALNLSTHGRFRRKKTCRIIADCLKKELDGKEFDEADARAWSTSIADAVRSRIHAECSAPRYKFVVQTFVGQQRLQDVRITSRCLWDNDHDNHASAVFHSVRACVCRGLFSLVSAVVAPQDVGIVSLTPVSLRRLLCK